MENALQTLSVLPANKSEYKSFIDSAKSAILNGYNEPLQVLKSLKILESIAKDLRTDNEIREMLENETDKYTEKTIEAHGCIFQKRETATYDYSECNDSHLNDLLEQEKQIKEAIKIRQSQLQSGLDAQTGEVLNKPTKTFRTSIAVSLK
jgi:hypothetical protein